jgi:hypothetical protein
MENDKDDCVVVVSEKVDMEVTPPPNKRSKTGKVPSSLKNKRTDSDKEERSVKLLQRMTEDCTMSKLMAVSEKLRRLPAEDLKTINAWTMLADVPVGEVLEVERCDTIETSFGPMALLDCITSEGKKRVGAPERYDEKKLYPCIMVYLGKGETPAAKDQGKSRQYHCLRRTGGLDDYGTRDNMHKRAEEWRAMSIGELREALEIKSLKHFLAGTVFVYSSPRVQAFDGKETGNTSTTIAHIVNFSTQLDGKSVTGEVFVPSRYASQLEREPQGIMVFRGTATAKGSGREFFDLQFLSQRDAELLTVKQKE